MRICVVHRYPPSLLRTSDISFPIFVRKLLEHGYKVYFLSFKESTAICRLEGVCYKPINLTFNRVKKLDRNFKSILFIFIVPLLALRLAFREKIDLFYCHDSLPGYASFIKMAVNGRTPVVMRLGDLMTGYILDGKNKIMNLLFKFIFCIEREMWKKVDGIICISNAFKEFLVACGVPQSKISVVEESVDITAFSLNASGGRVRRMYGIKTGPLIMSHGILVPWKGMETLINAIPFVLNQVPNAKFIIAGDGPSLNSLKNLVRKLRITDHVIFAGWIPYQKIPEYLSACDIGIVMRSGILANNFILTTALLQLWACGKAIVAPRLWAISQVVIHGENGLLFRPDDPEDLAEKIVYLIENPSMARKFGEKGITSARKKFDCNLVGEKFAYTLESYARKIIK